MDSENGDSKTSLLLQDTFEMSSNCCVSCFLNCNYFRGLFPVPFLSCISVLPLDATAPTGKGNRIHILIALSTITGSQRKGHSERNPESLHTVAWDVERPSPTPQLPPHLTNVVKERKEIIYLHLLRLRPESHM